VTGTSRGTFAPTEAELKAVGEAEMIVRYAAEHVADLDPVLARTISTAREAAFDGEWTPDLAGAFWNAFHALCIAIKPVTVECLTTAEESVPTIGFWKSKSRPTTLADRSSYRYSAALIVISIIVMLLQVYVWICHFEPQSIDGKRDVMLKSFANFSTAYQNDFLNTLNADIDQKKVDSDIKLRQGTFDLCRKFSTMAMDIAQLNFENGVVTAFPFVPSYLRPTPVDLSGLSPYSAQIFEKSLRPEKLSGLSGKEISDLVNAQTCEMNPEYVPGEYRRIAGAVNSADLAARYAHEVATFLSSLLIAYILPVLLGTMGAIAFVLRQISRQVRSTSFSKTSPALHWTRMIMGALSGLVVGFFSGEIPAAGSLPPLALAFLAGYGVEALFLVFDDIIGRFRSGNGSGPGAADAKRKAPDVVDLP
jgi:hypothetical protein